MVVQAESNGFNGLEGRGIEFKAFFKHMDYSEALADYAERKLASCASTYLKRGGAIQVTFAVEGGRHSVHLHLTGSVDIALKSEGRDSESNGNSNSIYACVDRIQDKLDETLRRRKERWTEHHSDGGPWEELERIEQLEKYRASARQDEKQRVPTIEESVDAAYVINVERAKAGGA